METLISLFIGAAVTWIIAWFYYKKAGDKLRKEAAELRKLNSIILTALERQGWAKLNRDKSGNIIGFIFEYTGSVGIRLGSSVETEFVPANELNQVKLENGT